MKGKYWLLFYVFVLIADLAFVYTKDETLRYFTKPLLMPLLIIFFRQATQSIQEPLRAKIILALFFSWAGDVLLMFEPVNNLFFIWGLISFLLAHVFYILFYDNIVRYENLRKNYWWFLPITAYCVGLVYLLMPKLGDMKMPVIVYSIVIGYMLLQALQISRIKNKSAALLMIIGAILFIASDSLLAINKFYISFELAGLAVMSTYGLAQLLITLGAIRYITSGSKE
jgi:uncharacterized membrane protein YhhN